MQRPPFYASNNALPDNGGFPFAPNGFTPSAECSGGSFSDHALPSRTKPTAL